MADALCSLLAGGVVLVSVGAPAQLPAADAEGSRRQTLAPGEEQISRLGAVFKDAPAPVRHYEGVTAAEVENRVRQRLRHEALLRERGEGRWFAILLEETDGEPSAVKGRFETWSGLLEFLSARNALVDVWAYPEAGRGAPRRILGPELARLKNQRPEQPTFITVTYPEATTGTLVTCRVEFGGSAASSVLAAHHAYQRHRQLQLTIQEVLGARGADGRMSAIAQWEALEAAVSEDRLTMVEMPPRPLTADDLFVAVECEVDESRNYRRGVRAYRESQIALSIVDDAQVLILGRPGETSGREAGAFRTRVASDLLEPRPWPIPGQDNVELRVRDPDQADPRRWNALEFGEPELVQQSALARFGLISAYLDKRRKEIAVHKSKLDLIAESIIAGLNIGGGLAGVAFPIGASARLGYDAFVVPRFIPRVPSVPQMRELFQLMAAKRQDPTLRTKPGDFLDADDFRRLREGAKELSDAQMVDYLQSISNDDLKGMLRIAKMQRIDASVVNLLSVIAEAGKVSGWTDEAGFQRDVFNSIYFSVAGDVSIKNIIAVLVGGSVATPRSGVSLQDLSHGSGPTAAWLQYLDFTVDIRAVVNTVARLTHRSLADKELKKPFPSAPRLSDLAAYEIRIFGFPLLIFHKRGLLKSDLAAFTNDYAYGMLGTRIIEHFPTQEAMDAEIRSGRMVPLGYVRVLDARGRWTDTNLAVFAHRVAAGKHRGKTTIIIYGLKAYAAHSQYSERELRRFRQFEEGLREGMVIEQLVEVEDRTSMTAREFEPVLQVGPSAGQEIYAPLLGNLLELRRAGQRQAWGLPLTPDERKEIDAIRGELASRGIWLADGDPLLWVDRFSSSFVYRKYVGGKWQDVKVTHLPSLVDTQRELEKAEEALQIERMRAEAAAGRSVGVVFLNEVREVNGRYEVGPLRHDAGGRALGVGVSSGPKALAEIGRLIDRLPVRDRARLRFNNYAATLVELEVGPGETRERVFVTIEFPPGEVEREWTNPLSGEWETLVYDTGLWRRTVTDRRIVELDYDEAGHEAGSRTYFNRGSRQTPLRGALLEETHPLELWFRDLSQPDLDPYLPMVAKLRVDYVTGQVSRDTYGLFPLPIKTEDDLLLTEFRFNDQGVLRSAMARANGVTAADSDRPRLARVLQPVVGVPRFRSTPDLPEAELEQLRDLRSLGYRMTVVRQDLIRGLTKWLTYDYAHSGRLQRERYAESLDARRSGEVLTSYEYQDDRGFGLIPCRAATTRQPGATIISEATTTEFDPEARRLTAREVDYTGRSSLKVWDYRWENPVAEQTELRRTVFAYDRFETSITGETTARDTGEPTSRLQGHLDPATGTWTIEREVWFRPGITLRTEVETRTRFGRLLALRLGDELEIRAIYDERGLEVGRRVWWNDPLRGGFDQLVREEGDYHWREGERDAQVRTFVEGQPYDVYRTLADPEGRLMVDGRRELPGLDLRTVLVWDGATDRCLRAEVIQNDRSREVRRFLRESQQPDGTWLLPVATVPFWGLPFTNTYRLNAILPRPRATTYANGDDLAVLDWFAGAAIPRVSELRDRHGRVTGTMEKRLRVGTEVGLGYDREARYRIDPWGNSTLAGEKAVACGTDTALFEIRPGETLHFNLRQPFDLPQRAVDPSQTQGMPVRVGGVRFQNVTAVFGSRFAERRSSNDPGGGVPERVLVLERIDLRGLFSHQLTRTTLDAAGRVLEERLARIPLLSVEEYSDQDLFQAAATAEPDRWFEYRYDPGWLVEASDPGTRVQALCFLDQRSPPNVPGVPVNHLGWRDVPTRIDGTRAVPGLVQDLVGRSHYRFRTFGTPRQLRRNAFMPQETNAWTAWTMTEWNPAGDRSFDAEVVLGGRGEPSVVRADKITSRGRPATKVTYHLASSPPTGLREIAMPPPQPGVHLDTAGRADFTACDFVYFHLINGRNARLVVRDGSGRQLRIGPPGLKRGEPSFWPVGEANVRWVPGTSVPEHGAVLNAPASLIKEGELLAVSVHDLATAGLDVRRLVDFVVEVESDRLGPLRVSELRRLEHGGTYVPARESDRFIYAGLEHSSGLKVVVRAGGDPAEQTPLSGLGLESVVQLDGLPVAVGRSQLDGESYPFLVWLDSAGAEEAEPLFALAQADGGFLDRFKTLELGDRYLYTGASRFELPRLDVFRSAVLDDEVAPGFVAKGRAVPASIPLAKAQSPLGRIAARFHNRVVANAFKLGADAWLGRPPAGDRATEILVRCNASSAADASSDAEAVRRLPSPAQALLPRRELPWRPGLIPSETRAAEVVPLRRLAQTRLLESELPVPPGLTNTGLLPTSPGTAASAYADTVQEAGLAMLALRVEESALARSILEFYWKQTHAGTRNVHAAYETTTGASRAYDPLALRPLHAPQTVGAQLAIAEAAFALWAKAGDPWGFALGSNLLSRVLEEFRPEGVAPRGITEYPADSTRQVLGLTLWPRRAIYSVRSNSRFYLLLTRLTDREARRWFSNEAWDRMVAARREQELWLRSHVLAEAERTGVVPSGLFEVQHARSGTSALAPERGTATADWLAWLEAADALGVPRERTRPWLEHLARVHGVWVNGTWGLDWSIALQRPDAISPELTAAFVRVARQLGHAEAAAWAEGNLSALRGPDTWPAVVTLTEPDRPLPTGAGTWITPGLDHTGWPQSLLVLNELLAGAAWDVPTAPRPGPNAVPVKAPTERIDLAAFLLITAAFYVSILAMALFWWAFRAWRLRWLAAQAAAPGSAQLVPDSVMQSAEERWARRVCGVVTPETAGQSRFSNAPVEQNFHVQLRAIHKMVLEWRRCENGWSESDRRMVEDESDDWLNGLDEFCTLVGLYQRWVIKAGAKDGFAKADVLAENEDSNHLWARLVLYFAEYHAGLLTLLGSYRGAVTERQKAGVGGQIVLLLNAMGLRQRAEGFDAAKLFNFPADPEAMDLLLIQEPGMTLPRLVDEMARRLRIPGRHIVRFIRRYKEFKRLEEPYPLHPYVIEIAKVLPHFVLVGLGALVFYNHFTVGDQSIVRYLWEGVVVRFVFAPEFRACGLLLLAGLILGIVASLLRTYRWEASMVSRSRPEFLLDRSLTALVANTSLVLPLVRPGRRWQPRGYQVAAWGCRVVGFTWLAGLLLALPTPSFATFLVVKGLLAMLAITEVASILLPALVSGLSKFLQDWVSEHSGTAKPLRFLNQLNLTATRPNSVLWQSLRYHFRPSAPSGSGWSLAQAVLFYFVLSGVFFGVGVFLCQEMLPLWFSQQYRAGADGKLVLGGLFFWCMLYLLRYGLFLLFTSVASALAAFPIKGAFGLLGLLHLGVALLGALRGWEVRPWTAFTGLLALVGLILMLWEEQVIAWTRRFWRSLPPVRRGLREVEQAFQQRKVDPAVALGVVYMSGDELSYHKLKPDLLMTRWRVLRDRLGSSALRRLAGAADQPDDATLTRWLGELYQAELAADVTLWHPVQLLVAGETPHLPAGLGLQVVAESAAKRERLLTAWQARRWLVTMMSTAGHAQDTGINLVDIALRLAQEGLAAQTVFYLIQNKYDDGAQNRPAQMHYDQGELGQRDKLARLLRHVAPGVRAHSLHNWTPFGFKAGGLTATDLVHEESLRLTTMVLLDRNATVHDLDALAEDVRRALSDPDVVIVIPGRTTTNTLTDVGQGSQMVEEGHRSFLQGLMALLGGGASESLGTGWGNILSVSYGQVQRAMVNPATPQMPLTSRMRRGSSLRLRLEGLIGFGPHAVGISEDTWAVSQATHNAVALGRRPKFLLSRALWHKLRETWSHAEWLASFPRWAGGYLQMMQDPLMQQINDFGPLSVFAREIRANSGRFYLAALLTLANILFMPLAIILDVTPFVQILIVLWNFGFVVNQVLTLHGLVTYLEGAGFHRLAALLGAFGATLAGLACDGLEALTPALAVLGFLFGGFIVGLSRWLRTRLRDLLLFGPQLVLHALGQFVRQSLEFVVSGASPDDARAVNVPYRAWAGPREDRPLDGFSGMINLRTVVWGAGLISLLLNVAALSRLDLLNVLMLLPSLLFSVSTLVGPFLLAPKPGRTLGFRAVFYQALGWLGGLAYGVLVSWLIGWGGTRTLLGALLGALPFGFLLRHALRYLGYRSALRRAIRRLAGLASSGGLKRAEALRFVEQLLRQSVSHRANAPALELAAIPASDRAEVHAWLESRIIPLLQAPSQIQQTPNTTSRRRMSELARSFVLSVFVSLWFLLVPAPGPFVVRAGPYQIATTSEGLLTALGTAITLGLAAAAVGAGVQWLDRRRFRQRGLEFSLQRVIRRLYGRFQIPSMLTAAEISMACALLTDALTSFDQRADARVRRGLEKIDRLLDKAPNR